MEPNLLLEKAEKYLKEQYLLIEPLQKKVKSLVENKIALIECGRNTQTSFARAMALGRMCKELGMIPYFFNAHPLEIKAKKYDVENFKTAADFELWFRVLEFGKFGTILKPLINYRQSSNSYSFRTRLRTEESDGIKVVKHFYIILENELLKEYKRKLDFYIFKDNVIRISNQILVDQKDYNLKLNIFMWYGCPTTPVMTRYTSTTSPEVRSGS